MLGKKHRYGREARGVCLPLYARCREGLKSQMVGEVTGRWLQCSTAGPFPSPRSSTTTTTTSSRAGSTGGCHLPCWRHPPVSASPSTSDGHPRRLLSLPVLAVTPRAGDLSAAQPACRDPPRRGCCSRRVGHAARPARRVPGRAGHDAWPVRRVPGRAGPSWQHGASSGSLELGLHTAKPQPPYSVSLAEEPAFHSSPSKAPAPAFSSALRGEAETPYLC